MCKSSDIYQEVKRLRASTPRGTPFVVQYDGKEIECKNLAVTDKVVSAAERRNPTSSRCRWLPNTNIAAPMHVPEPPQQPVRQLTEKDPEYWEELENVAMRSMIALGIQDRLKPLHA